MLRVARQCTEQEADVREHDAACHVREDDIASLVGRAVASRRFPDLEFSDPFAEELLAQLEFPPARFEDPHLRLVTLRARLVDEFARHFFERHPAGLAVAVHPGLCTRFSRVDNGQMRWLDLDPAGLTELKAGLLRTPDRHMLGTCCTAACSSWMDLLAEERPAALVIAQGALLRGGDAAFDGFLTKAVERLPSGTELIVDYDAVHRLRPTRRMNRGGALEVPRADGVVARYPRIRFVPQAEYSARLEHEAAGLDAVSRLFAGAIASVAHLRFV